MRTAIRTVVLLCAVLAVAFPLHAIHWAFVTRYDDERLSVLCLVYLVDNAYVLVVDQVPRLVHLAHPALAEQFEYFLM